MSVPNSKPDDSTAAKLGPQVQQGDTMRRAGLVQAITQLDTLISFFENAPERVKTSAKEFREALQEWSET